MRHPMNYHLAGTQPYSYSLENQSHYSQSQFSVDSTTNTNTTQASNSLSNYESMVGIKRPAPLTLSSNTSYSLNQPMYQSVSTAPSTPPIQLSPAPCTPPMQCPPSPTKLAYHENKTLTTSDHTDDFDLDDWSSLLDDDYKLHTESKKMKSSDNEIDFCSIKEEIQKNLHNLPAPHTESFVSSAGLKQVPGHPYLYYDDKHPLFPQVPTF